MRGTDLVPQGSRTSAGIGHISQLWLFWLAPIAGAILAGIVYPLIAGRGQDK